VFNATKKRERLHPVETVGKRLRALMPWIKAKTV
jgi:ketol-acid reductoisomerase